MRKKSPTILLAIFFGSLGFHRFYLGQYWRGVLYLFFCWTFIPFFIGIIDAFAIAFMPEERFHERYNKKIYDQAKKTASSMGMNTVQIIKDINESVKAEKMRILNYTYNQNVIKSKGIQMLESIYIIGCTNKIDTLKGRYEFVRQICDEMVTASHRYRYSLDVQTSIDSYKSRYYDRIPSECELTLLLKPDTNQLAKYYSINIYRCFTSHFKEQISQIDALKRQDAKERRYEKLIDVADEASTELTLSGDLSDQTTQFINEINAIREKLYIIRYESQQKNDNKSAYIELPI